MNKSLTLLIFFSLLSCNEILSQTKKTATKTQKESTVQETMAKIAPIPAKLQGAIDHLNQAELVLNEILSQEKKTATKTQTKSTVQAAMAKIAPVPAKLQGAIDYLNKAESVLINLQLKNLVDEKHSTQLGKLVTQMEDIQKEIGKVSNAVITPEQKTKLDKFLQEKLEESLKKTKAGNKGNAKAVKQPVANKNKK